VRVASEPANLDALTHRWVDGAASNFEYLLALNAASGRSWGDLTQYPIMPWVVQNYAAKQLNLADRANFRDLTLPLFAQSHEQQVHCFDYYRTTGSISSDPHCIPNYVSNVGSTLYYLVRMEPFTTEEIRFQGTALDAMDRTCQSLGLAYALMPSPAPRHALELVPECYFSAEVFQNINAVVFPAGRTGERIGDMVLLLWATSHRDCVRQLRAAIESPSVSEQLHEYIDLVWGYRRRGQPALDCLRVRTWCARRRPHNAHRARRSGVELRAGPADAV
jgi:hypothetical protein